MKVTIKEIAKLAGVHRSTVDKVLHNREGVSDEVRQNIQKLIKETGYEPNPVGRILQQQSRQYRIAAVMVDVDAFPYLKQGLEDGLKAWKSFNISFSFYVTKFDDVHRQCEILNQLIEDQVDGIILSPVNTPEVGAMIDRAADAGIPVVTTNSDVPESKRLCNVGQNEERASRIAGRMFSMMLGGRGKAAIVTSTIAAQNNNYYTKLRERVFSEYIRENHPDITIERLIECQEDYQLTYERTLEMLRECPDLNGIYITCGGASEVGRALCQTGKQHQIHVVSFEDYPEIISLLQEEVIDCTISSELSRQGSLPVEVLMNYLAYQKKPEHTVMYTDTRIFVKESVSAVS